MYSRPSDTAKSKRASTDEKIPKTIYIQMRKWYLKFSNNLVFLHWLKPEVHVLESPSQINTPCLYAANDPRFAQLTMFKRCPRPNLLAGFFHPLCHVKGIWIRARNKPSLGSYYQRQVWRAGHVRLCSCIRACLETWNVDQLTKDWELAPSLVPMSIHQSNRDNLYMSIIQ